MEYSSVWLHGRAPVQGNQGINFGVRRQITSAAPKVPSLAEKERKRKEKAAEEDRLQQQANEEDQRRQAERKLEEERAKEEEERQWEDQTRRQRDDERRRIEEQKRQWEDQERQWRLKEDMRKKEDAEMESTLTPRDSVTGRGVLRGQSLSQYQKDQASTSKSDPAESPEQARVRELEKQLEEARERERQYQAEREERLREDGSRSRPTTAHAERPVTAQNTRGPESSRESDASWVGDEREYLRNQWQDSRDGASSPAAPAVGAQRVLPFRSNGPTESQPPRLLPKPTESQPEPDEVPSTSTRSQQLPRGESNLSINVPDTNWQPASSPIGSPSRPKPAPETQYSAYSPDQPTHPRNPFQKRQPAQVPAAPTAAASGPRISNTRETGDTSLEQHRDRDARRAAATQTKALAATSKSLLEREMERERERQREWEANQMASSAGRSSEQPTGPRGRAGNTCARGEFCARAGWPQSVGWVGRVGSFGGLGGGGE